MDAGWIGSHPPDLDSGETSHWWPIVLNVAQGRGYCGCFPEYFPFCGPANQVTAAREPVPVLLFAAVARLTTGSLLPAALVETALNSGILIGIFLLAQRLAGPRVADRGGAALVAVSARAPAHSPGVRGTGRHTRRRLGSVLSRPSAPDPAGP